MSDGCSGCVFLALNHGDAWCTHKPHNYDTPLRRSITQWLTETAEPFKAQGCPGYQPYDGGNDG